MRVIRQLLYNAEFLLNSNFAILKYVVCSNRYLGLVKRSKKL